MSTKKNVNEFKISGFKESVVSVLDIDYFEAFFISLGGWETRYRGTVSKAQLKAWQLPDHVEAEESLIANRNEDTGQMRLVKFTSSDKQFEQQHMRPDAQCWDTGGINTLSMRVVDLKKTRQQLHAIGWQSYSAPSTYHFGGLATDEWVPRAPNGMSCSFVERLTPKLTGWPHLKKISRIFNSSQTVKNFEESVQFYKDVLDFKTFAGHTGTMAEAGANPLGLPYNMANTEIHNMEILHPDGVCDGSVELISFDTFKGADFSEQTRFPNLGPGSLKFPVQNIAALFERIKTKKVKIITPLVTVMMEPYGNCSTFIISSPDGAWLEFFEIIE